MAKRNFRRNLTIFLGVNALGLVFWAVVLFSGLPVAGELWIYPVAMVVWGLLIAVQGYRAYHEPAIPEVRIQREINNLS